MTFIFLASPSSGLKQLKDNKSSCGIWITAEWCCNVIGQTSHGINLYDARGWHLILQKWRKYEKLELKFDVISYFGGEEPSKQHEICIHLNLRDRKKFKCDWSIDQCEIKWSLLTNK